MPKSFYESLKNQWDSMQCLPLSEYELNIDGEFMVVHFDFTNQGITFTVDLTGMFEPKIHFSGEVCKPYANRDDIFMLPFDPDFDKLDHYLRQIDQEIIEGFLIPNDLLAV